MTYEETTRRPKKARKQFTCNECKTPITAGTIYIRNSEKIDGKFNALTRHSDCIEAADILDAEVPRFTDQRLFLVPLIEANPEIKSSLTVLLADFPDVLKRLNDR